MKLDYKRTFWVGLAFFSICAFWQAYDYIIPLILRDTFHLGDTVSGFIMSIDNILALFLLPLFGMLSDRAGRRMPFIIGGTAAAVALTLLIPAADNSNSLSLFFVALGLLLIAMATYRSPAVALMPDVTPKPLRSKGNAVINLMGALGGLYTLGAIRFLLAEPADGVRVQYLPVFIAVAAIMAVSVVLLKIFVNEKKLVSQMRQINYGVDPADEPAVMESGKENTRLSPAVRASLILILTSVALWYMGYNAVVTAFSKYATQVWGQDASGASTCLLVANAGAIISYLPIGALSSRIGRKRTILIGVAALFACFAAGALVANSFSPALYVMFALVGFAWAAINVNSFPMVVEISRAGSVGKYTGYYYTFSMAAQIVTPIVSGTLLEHVGYHTLFPYAAAMVALSFVTMLFTRHGDNRPERKKGIEAYDE